MQKLSRDTMIFSKQQYFIFILSMIALIFFCYFYVDRAVATYFIEHADTYKVFGKKMSTLGESQWYIGSAIVGALYFTYIKKNELYKQRFLFLLYANIFSGLLSIVLKTVFGRIRPWKLENGDNLYGFLIAQNPDFTFLQNIKYQINMILQNSTYYTSFPSGHTITSSAVFVYLYILFPRYLYLWLAFTIMSIASRILANDHFISDVLAGILVGVLSTLFVYSKMKEKIEKVS